MTVCGNLFFSVLINLLLTFAPFSLAKDKESLTIFNSKVISGGPIAIYSDSLSCNFYKRYMCYDGNVCFLQTDKESINLILNDFFCENNIFLFDWYTHFDYNLNKYYSKNRHCNLKKSFTYLRSAQLKFLFSENNKDIAYSILKADTSHKVALYCSNIGYDKSDILNSFSQKNSIYLEGDLVLFDFQNKVITIDKNAYLEYKGNIFMGSTIIFNVEYGLITVLRDITN